MLKSLALVFSCIALVACGPMDKPTSTSPGVSGDLAREATAFTGQSSRLIGRFDQRKEGRAAFTWPGSAVAFRFKGTAASIGVASTDRIRFQVEVDGASHELWVEPGERLYKLATGLQPGVHKVRLTRLAESFSGVTALTTDPVTDGELLAPAAAPDRQLLVLGDSITAGYGVEGDSKDCKYSQDTSSPLLAYAGLTANALNADAHLIAWSGIGAWRSYGEKEPAALTIRDRSLFTLGDDSASTWDAARYRPDVIVIAIGTNDFWEGTSPGYRAAMAELVNDVQADYPETPIYLMVSPMLTGAARAAQKTDLQSLASMNVQVVDVGAVAPADGFGCDYHPNTITQARLAKGLTEKLQADLHWQ